MPAHTASTAALQRRARSSRATPSRAAAAPRPAPEDTPPRQAGRASDPRSARPAPATPRSRATRARTARPNRPERQVRHVPGLLPDVPLGPLRHVRLRSGGWQVHKDDGDRPTGTYANQEQAIDAALALARKDGGAVVVHPRGLPEDAFLRVD